MLCIIMEDEDEDEDARGRKARQGAPGAGETEARPGKRGYGRSGGRGWRRQRNRTENGGDERRACGGGSGLEGKPILMPFLRPSPAQPPPRLMKEPLLSGTDNEIKRRQVGQVKEAGY